MSATDAQLPASAAPASSTVPVIAFAGVTKVFETRDGKVEALGPVDLVVEPGTFVSLVGPSGCGKSTLLRIMAGLDHATGGKLQRYGGPLDGPSEEVGIAFQEHVLFPWLTVLQNVMLPAEILSLPKRAAETRARGLLEMTGLKEFADVKPQTLSGGMKQRAAFCRSILANPRFLLLDEPFGALDALTREELSLELSRLWGELGRTAFLITHDIDEAILLGDRVLVMSKRPGRIIADIPVPLPRPRTIRSAQDPVFQQIKQQVRELDIRPGGVMTRFRNLANSSLTPLVYVVVVIAWEIMVDALKIPAWLLPAPSAIAAAAVKWAPELVANTLVTTRETVFGFVLALMISIPLACLVAFNSWARKILYPALLGLQSVPKVALAPLITLWLGFTEWPKIVIVVLVCFFPILVNLIAGFESVPKAMIDLMRSLNASHRMILWRLRAPAALPAFFTGCKVAITFAVIGAVIGEFVAAQEGLGYMILMSTSQSQTPLAFAAILALTALSVVLFYAIELVERRCVNWSY